MFLSKGESQFLKIDVIKLKLKVEDAFDDIVRQSVLLIMEYLKDILLCTHNIIFWKKKMKKKQHFFFINITFALNVQTDRPEQTV